MFKRLKIAMYARDMTQELLCKKLKKSQTYLTSRFNGSLPFTIEDIYSICDLLMIPLAEVEDYFPRKSDRLERK